MKIQKIEITNYKAFLGNHKINVGGKNLFIYGENGSGKSSLYYALKDFFQSSVEDIDIDELKNVFVPAGNTEKTAINIIFKPNSQGQNKQKNYSWNNALNDSREVSDTSIRDSNKLKSFLTYKHLLAIHYVKKNEFINLFDLLVNGVLKHFKYALSHDKELGELWSELQTTIIKKTGKEYPINKKKADANVAIKAFNEAFGELFKEESPENILKHAKPILEKFNHNIELDLNFPQVRPIADYLGVTGTEVKVTLKYAGKVIDKPHLFLNEARLSAIAISIYLGMIKRHAQNIPCKVLFLDDVFIGLDIANRLPLLSILETEFPDYQIFITTYDKPWFEYVKGILEQRNDWKTMEFYAQDCADSTDIPLIFDNQNLLTKAEHHLQSCDYKAAAVYTRSAFEMIIRKHCEMKKKKLVFKSQLKNYSSQDFWTALKVDLSEPIISEIETYRSLVLNTFSHYNTDRHEIKPELESAIQAVKNLKTELARL